MKTLVVLFGALALVGRAQLPRDAAAASAGTAIVRGRVLAADTGEPVRKARVTLSTFPDGTSPLVLTDNAGRFVFSSVPAGQYTILARKAGFATTAFGSRGSMMLPVRIDLATGAAIDGIDVHMPRSAAISGRIVDELGDPIEMAMVSAQRIVRTAGRSSGVAAGPAVFTDDLGEFFLGGLSAGRFVVSATAPLPQSGTVSPDTASTGFVFRRTGTQPRTYYPGVIASMDCSPANTSSAPRSATSAATISLATRRRIYLAPRNPPKHRRSPSGSEMSRTPTSRWCRFAQRASKGKPTTPTGSRFRAV